MMLKLSLSLLKLLSQHLTNFRKDFEIMTQVFNAWVFNLYISGLKKIVCFCGMRFLNGMMCETKNRVKSREIKDFKKNKNFF